MSKSNLTAASPSDRPSEAAIAKRAYEISLQRGSTPGHEVDDWLQAEAELHAAMAKPETARQDDPGDATDSDGGRGAAPGPATASRTPERGGTTLDAAARRARERSGRRSQRQPHGH